MKENSFHKNKIYKNPQDLLDHCKSGEILANVHKLLKANAKVGVSLLALDKLAYDYILQNDAIPSFLNYQNFPNSICTSVNDVLIHGIPSDYKLQNGDLLSVDVGVKYKDFHTDAAFSMVIGTNAKAQKIIDATYEALDAAIKLVKPGLNVKEIGKAIEKVAKAHGYKLTHIYSGHGVGKKLHTEPYIFNYFEPKYSYILKANTAIAIEPMFLESTEETFVDSKDKWSVHSLNGCLTAHVEHTILITNDGHKILTK